MISAQFLGINAHFAVNVMASLVAFAVCWLRFDAWTVRRSRAELLSWVGFALLTTGFLVSGSALAGGSGVADILITISVWAKLAGLAAITTSQLLEPLQSVPDISTDTDRINLTASASSKTKPKKPRHTTMPIWLPPTLSGSGLTATSLAITLLTALVAGLYWRRATQGLERHLKPLAYGFLVWAAAEAALAATTLPAGNNPFVERTLAVYGPVWWLGLAASLTGSLMMGRWVWSYLTKRLVSQLYMALIAQVIVIFLVVTASFTYLMLRDVKNAQLGDLQTASRVLDYAIASRQAQNQAEAQTAAASSNVAAAVAARNRVGLAASLTSFYSEHKVSSLLVTDAAGVVLWRAEDPERYGDSVSSDALIRRAQAGRTASSVTVSSGVSAPAVALTAVSPITGSDGLVIGTVTLGFDVSEGFVDGIEASTGLSSTVYGGHTRAATTIKDARGNRTAGVSMADATINSEVLEHNHSYTGTTLINNRQYLTAITPLVNIDGQPVGMLQAARPATDLFMAAGHSLQLMLLVASVLLLCAAVPLFKLAKLIERQLR